MLGLLNNHAFAQLSILLYLLIGLLAGKLLGKIANEELQGGKKYFKHAQYIIFALITVLLINILPQPSIAFAPYMIVGWLLTFIIRNAYFMFSILIVSIYPNFLLLIPLSVFIFIYGLCEGSLLHYNKATLNPSFFAALLPFALITVFFTLTPFLVFTQPYSSLILLGYFSTRIFKK